MNTDSKVARRTRRLATGKINGFPSPPSRSSRDTFTAREFKVVAVREAPVPYALRKCDTPAAAAEYWLRAIADHGSFLEDRESLYVLHLNAKHRVTGHHMVAIGTVDSVSVHPRDVFRGAIVGNAHGVMLVHNHPSNEVVPSAEDIAVTFRLRRVGRMLGIPVHDHIIVGQPPRKFYQSLSVCSLRQVGCFSRRKKQRR